MSADDTIANPGGDGEMRKPRMFEAGPEDRARLREVASALLSGTEGEEDIDLTPEEEEKLLAELEANYQQAVRVFETKFVDLPSIAQIRALWREKKITDEDPIWTVVETMSLHDARSQLMLSQVMRVISTGHDLMRFSVRRVERVQRDLARVTEEAGRMEARVIEAKAEVSALNDQLALFGKTMPELLEAMARSQEANDSATWRAKGELIGIGFVGALGGVAAGSMRIGDWGGGIICAVVAIIAGAGVWWLQGQSKRRRK